MEVEAELESEWISKVENVNIRMNANILTDLVGHYLRLNPVELEDNVLGLLPNEEYLALIHSIEYAHFEVEEMHAESMVKIESKVSKDNNGIENANNNLKLLERLKDRVRPYDSDGATLKSALLLPTVGNRTIFSYLYTWYRKGMKFEDFYKSVVSDRNSKVGIKSGYSSRYHDFIMQKKYWKGLTFFRVASSLPFYLSILLLIKLSSEYNKLLALLLAFPVALMFSNLWLKKKRLKDTALYFYVILLYWNLFTQLSEEDADFIHREGTIYLDGVLEHMKEPLSFVKWNTLANSDA